MSSFKLQLFTNQFIIINIIIIHIHGLFLLSFFTLVEYHIFPTPPLRQDMTQG